jgi:hypothetical protein
MDGFRKFLAAAALASTAAGCAPALSTMQPATVAPYKSVDAGMGYGVSVPVAGITRSVGTARENVDRTQEGEPLSDGDRDDIIKTSLGLALNPPSLGSQYRIGYGILEGTEVELRYALSAWRLGARYQVVKPEVPAGLAVSAGLGVSRYVFSLGVPSYLKPIVDVDDFTRYDIDVPVLFGASHEVFHVWGGPKLVASFMSAGIDVCTQIDTDSKECTERSKASIDGRAFYLAGQAGGAIGYKYVWVAAELTAAYVDVQATAKIQSGDIDEKRRFQFGDVILYPLVGVIVRY